MVTPQMAITLRNFWYVVAESHELNSEHVLSRQVLGEPIAIFRDVTGQPAALRDRCLHRNAPLSSGRVSRGQLQCGYHGWTYDLMGSVVRIPSQGSSRPTTLRCVSAYETCEQQGYVYVRLEKAEDSHPFNMPHYGERPWRHIRVQNRFENTLTNCVENFVDIPHTAYVHDRLFRSECQEVLNATVRRTEGTVEAVYRNEKRNLGLFKWFLNPAGNEIRHVDRFHMPNVTCVEYVFGPHRKFIITSQSVPVSKDETLVYTDLTYDYGIWSDFARPFVRWAGQRVIDQDCAILKAQHQAARRFGETFSHTPADIIHVFIESIQRELEQGKNPRELPELTREIEFYV
jgi:phenylpropionate dioxygenase-like ring-hydroxylating dioxygenase large terminal subunit